MRTFLNKGVWALVARGLMATLFGIAVLRRPAMMLRSMTFLFSLYALVGGACAIIGTTVRSGPNRWQQWMLLEGLAGIIAGALVLCWPGISTLAFISILAVWIVVSGVADLAINIGFREFLGGWLAVGGALSLPLGLLLLIFPAYGAMALKWTLGTYALVTGLIMLVLAARLGWWNWLSMD